MTAEQVLFGMIRGVICGVPFEDKLKTACTEEMLGQVYKLAARQDLAHLVGQAVSDMGLAESATVSAAKEAAMSAFLRHMRLEQEVEATCQVLDREGIPHILLKGSVLKALYPEAWLRTSCDADILVPEAQLNRAVNALQEGLGYRAGERGAHDVALQCPSGAHIELHFDLVEEGRANSARQILRSVWERANPAASGGHRWDMDDALFYFYHIAHMAKHFEVGGCGVRPFIDLWLMERENRRTDCHVVEAQDTTLLFPQAEKSASVLASPLPHKSHSLLRGPRLLSALAMTAEGRDELLERQERIATGASALAMTEDGREALLEAGGLLTFAQVARKLSRVWLDGEEHDRLSQQMEEFLFRGGVYGSVDNRVALLQNARGGKLGYLLSRVFVPTDKLKHYYPILEDKPWLAPVMQVRRWGWLLKPDVAARAKKELAVSSAGKDDQGSLLQALGLEDGRW